MDCFKFLLNVSKVKKKKKKKMQNTKLTKRYADCCP